MGRALHDGECVVTKFLSRMSLKYQIGLIGAVGVIGSLAFLGIYSLQMWSQDRQQRMMDGAANFHDMVQDTANDLLQARRHEKDFLLRRQDTYADQEIKAVASAVDRLSAMEKLPETASQRDHLKTLGEGIKTYGDRFKQVVDTQRTLGLNENAGLQGELRTAVHDVEDLLGKFHETNLDNVMLMMRRHEKDFMLRLDPSYGDQMKKRATEFAPALASSGLPAAVKAEVAAKMAVYQKDFAALLDGTMANVDNVKKLSESYSAVEPVLADLIKVAQDQYDAAKQDYESKRVASERLLYVALIASIAFIAAFAWILSQSISRALVAMAGAMKTIADGDLKTDVPARDRQDEVGAMAKALDVFKCKLEENARLEAAQAAAEEEKRREAEKAAAEREARQMRLGELIQGFDATMQEVLRTVTSAATELQATAESMSATAEETARQSSAVAAASEQATSNVQTVAAATEELAASVQEVGRQASQSAQVARSAVTQAEDTNGKIEGLAAAVQKIGDVAHLINDIANQTNLLALNATIEAARAGEAGKGFAVVAGEVKSLASQTGKATEEISGQIAMVQSATSSVVEAIKTIRGTIAETNEVAAAIASAVEEQSATTKEIAANVQEAAAGTAEVSRNIEGVTQAAGQTGAASAQVLASAGDLARQAEVLRTAVNDFFTNVRAA